MLTLTDSAVATIRDLLAEKGMSEMGGLRISSARPRNGDGEPSFELAVVCGPEPTDAVVGQEGVHVYVEPSALAAFSDRVLDACLNEAGVSFTFLPSSWSACTGCG